MKNLSKQALAASLLTCTVAAMASTPAHHNNHHWNIGFQGAVGTATVDSDSSFQSSEDGDDFYSDYTSEEFASNSSKTAGLYGAHLGYEWNFHNNIWQASLSANLASGNIASHEIADHAENGDIVFTESTKLKSQYNLMLSWKHFVNQDIYLSLGAGISQINMRNSLRTQDVDPTDTDDIYEGTLHKTIHSTGASFKLGLGCYLSDQSSIDMGLTYSVYNTKTLPDSTQLNLNDGDDYPEYMRNRSTQLSLFTLSAGYSYHF